MADSYVCSGAVMRCTFGTSQPRLVVLPDRTVWLAGQRMANISDHRSMANIPSFGRCRTVTYPPTGSATAAHHGHLTPMPCVPGTVTPWMPGKTDYLIQNSPALLKSCKCLCQWGGVITITDDGQHAEGTQYVNKEAKDDGNETGPNVHDILDGLQLALDAAGLVPGFGMVPDLINAAISAFRGDWTGAAFSLVAAVPGIGDAAGAAKLAKNGVKMAGKAKKTQKAAAGTRKLKFDVKKYAGRDIDLSKEALMSKGFSREEAVMIRRQVRNERRAIAKDFYKQKGFKNIDSHVSCIDLEKPVRVGKVPPAGQESMALIQYRSFTNGEYKMGSYFTASADATADSLGTSGKFFYDNQWFDKVKFIGTVDEPVDALFSTARKATDTWTSASKAIQTAGGGKQIFAPDLYGKLTMGIMMH